MPPRRGALPPRAAGVPRRRERDAVQGQGHHRDAAPTRSQIQGTTQSYPTGDGTTSIPVTLASSYTGDPAVAQTYATFLGTLPHGPELASLKVTVVPSSEIASACGGDPSDGILACYGADDQTMIVPGDQAAGCDISVNYVIAHEYGHHIAAHRSNAPLAALDFGPKKWSSYELVCSNTLDGKLAPGDQGANYLSNPGEAWAESYARLIYPDEAWRFTPMLAPSKGSALAAMADVAQPWTKRVSQTFNGTGTKTVQAADHARRRLHAPARRPGAGQLRPDRPLGRQGRRPHHPRRTPRTASTTGSPAATAGPRRCGSRCIKRSGPGGPYTLTAKYAG